MQVPFIDLKRFEPGFLDQIQAKLQVLISQAQFIGGAEVSALEVGLMESLDVAFAVSCANGTDALQLALRALGVGRGDQVLVPDVTFWATFEAVVNVGADPVTLDADLRDGGVDFSALEQALGELKPKAVVIAHLYGWGSARLDEIRAMCRSHGVPLLEDGAQCFGVRYQGRSIFEGALISTTSFYPAKVLGGAGDGGAVFTADAELAERVRRLGNHGRASHYGYSDVGWNSRMDAIQAAFLNEGLKYIDQRVASRRAAAEYYYQNLSGQGLVLMKPPATYEENGYCNVCLVADPSRKERLERALKAQGIGFGNIYPGAMSCQPGSAGVTRGHFGGNAGAALCSSVLNLPLFSYMTEAELAWVVEVVRATLAE